MRAAVVLAVCLCAGPASADDGYCDYVQGVASAESALLFAPEVFAQFGYIEQSAATVTPDVSEENARFIGGIRYRVSGIYEGFAVKNRAKADCRRHRALEQVRGETLHRALEARAKVLEDALAEAEKLLRQTNADLEARRTTAQEATATRLRVDELRRIATDTRAALRALPAPSGGDLAGALTTYQRADADVESYEAKLRRAQAIDVSVRFGLDDTLGRDDNPGFALVSVGVNLGVLFQGKGNARAAAGRKKLVRAGRDPMSIEATSALVEATSRRAQETATLEADLSRQLEALARVGGDDSRRYRMIVWFDWIKVKAERAFHDAYLEALQQVVGGTK